METHRNTHIKPLTRRIRWGNVALALIVMAAIAGLVAQLVTQRQSTPEGLPRTVLEVPATSPTGPTWPVAHRGPRAKTRPAREKRRGRRQTQRRAKRKTGKAPPPPQVTPRYVPEPRDTAVAPPGTGDLEP